MTATTALTAQNTLGVDDVHITPPAFVAKQIDACLRDIGCDVVKLGRLPCHDDYDDDHVMGIQFVQDSDCAKGMVASAETIQVIADALRQYDVSTIVLDPVSR